MLTAVPTDKGIIEVSTIGPHGSLVRFPETCIFRLWIPTGQGQSEVVATYSDMEEAYNGHATIVEKVREGVIT